MPEHLCPWWIGYLLASPLRRLVQDPDELLSPYVKEGMRVLDVGPGMGFFTLPMARMVGPEGKVFAVDIQEEMLQSLERRARRAGLHSRIECRRAEGDSLRIAEEAGAIDFALVFAVAHEVPSLPRLPQPRREQLHRPPEIRRRVLGNCQPTADKPGRNTTFVRSSVALRGYPTPSERLSTGSSVKRGRRPGSVPPPGC